MPEASPIRLQCEIESLEDPIHGHVTGESGLVVPFHGWIELAAALAAAAAGAPPTPPHQEHPHDHH